MTSPKLQSIWPVEPEPITVSLTSAVTCRLSLPSRRYGSSSSGRDQVGAQRDAAVLALGLPDRQLALQLLQVSRGPVVEDGVADDGLFGLLDRQVLAGRSDDRADLQFEVLPSASGSHRGVVVGAENRCRTGEVERRDAIPGVGEFAAGTHERPGNCACGPGSTANRGSTAGAGSAPVNVTSSSRTTSAGERSASSPASRSPSAPRPIRSSSVTPGGIAWIASPESTPVRSPLRLRYVTHFIRVPPHLVSCPAAARANSIGAAGCPGSTRCSAPRRPAPARRTSPPWRRALGSDASKGDSSVCSGASVFFRLASSRSVNPVPTRPAKCRPPSPGIPISSAPMPLLRPPSPASPAADDDFLGVPVLVLDPRRRAPARLIGGVASSWRPRPPSRASREYSSAWAPSPGSSSGTMRLPARAQCFQQLAPIVVFGPQQRAAVQVEQVERPELDVRCRGPGSASR